MVFGLAQIDGDWIAGFDKDGGFTPNLRWEMQLLVDGKPIHSGTAVVGKSGLALLSPRLSPRAVKALSDGDTLQVVTKLGRFTYSLAGSADAREFVEKCVAHYLAESQPRQRVISRPSKMKDPA